MAQPGREVCGRVDPEFAFYGENLRGGLEGARSPARCGPEYALPRNFDFLAIPPLSPGPLSMGGLPMQLLCDNGGGCPACSLASHATSAAVCCRASAKIGSAYFRALSAERSSALITARSAVIRRLREEEWLRCVLSLLRPRVLAGSRRIRPGVRVTAVHT